MGRPGTDSAKTATVSILGEGELDGQTFAAFEVVRFGDDGVFVRAPLLFEIGEELRLLVDRGGDQREVRARVLAHRRDDIGTVTELSFVEVMQARKLVSGGSST